MEPTRVSKLTVDFAGKRRQFLPMIFVVGFILLFTLVFRTFSWAELEVALSKVPLQCPLKRWTGLSCAFCGMTHSWISLFRGEWREAFQFNLLGPPLLLFVVLSAIGMGFFRWRWSQVLSPRMAWISMSVFAVYAIARNLI